MFKVKVNNHPEHTIEFESSDLTSGKFDGTDFSIDMIELKNGSFHVIKNHQSYTVEIVRADHTEKSFVISVNGNKYSVAVKDKYDELLQKLGMDKLNSNKVNELKAPMPGLVLDIRVTEGDLIKKGDTLIVLEAMKMENSLKSPADATVKKVHVRKGIAVEKNQVLISFA